MVGDFTSKSRGYLQRFVLNNLFRSIDMNGKYQTKSWLERVVVIGVTKPPKVIELSGDSKYPHRCVTCSILDIRNAFSHHFQREF